MTLFSEEQARGLVEEAVGPVLFADAANAQLLKEVTKYVAWDPRTETREEALGLLRNLPSGASELKKRFLSRLQFGTAGLRGPMGCGFNCMNDLVVMQASQGLCLYLLDTFGQDVCTERGVVLGFDGRYNSQRYAHAAAAVFLAKGFKVYLNDKVTATPMNPFAIVKYKCLAGCQVTASHNPKNDNGFKVYAANGAQIIPPMDSLVAGLINANLQPWAEAVALLDPQTGFLKDVSKTINPYDDVFKAYMETMTSSLRSSCDSMSGSNLRVVYTAMHGVGYPFVAEILKRFGFPESNLHVVKEQQFPDPEFSTVAFPNPEEKGALDKAIALADAVNAPVIIANDPDADRFACAEKQKDGKWKIFHGDELGAIMGAESMARHAQRGVPKEKMLFMCSVVSSRMLSKMAEAEGCQFEETLSGFKWIINKSLELQQGKGLHPCLCYEEALGYALHPACPDKDGVSAAAVFTQLACSLYEKNQTLNGYLDDLRKKYGYFVTNNYYFLCYDKAAITQIFKEFRENPALKQSIGNYAVKRVRDVTKGTDTGEANGLSRLPMTPSSEMITIFFENGAVVTFRTSGTEPKLKYYFEMSGSDPVTAREELTRLSEVVIEKVLQPSKFPLLRPKA